MFPQIILRKDKLPYDRVIKVNKEDAYRMSNEVAKTDGVFLGMAHLEQVNFSIVCMS
jgi:cysteine synthase